MPEQILTTDREQCNKYDLTAVACFLLAYHNDGPAGLLLVVSHLFAVPVLVYKLGWKKSK